MAWCPFAKRLELQPESDDQPAIDPTQLILHSIAAPWDEQRIYEYWRDSTNLESHFGVDYDGSVGQFIGTQTRADANYRANLRPDGTGAVSVETASNLDHSDPWTPEQIETLIRLGVWLHQQHGIPLRICETASSPGYGYHRLHSDWSPGGTACPGDARVRQFREVVFPGIVARATGKTPAPTTPAPTPAQETDVPSMLDSNNPIDVPLPGGQWTPLALPVQGGTILAGPRLYDVGVHLSLTGLPPGARVEARFYRVTGKDRSDRRPQQAHAAADGTVDARFADAGQLAAGESLHLDVRPAADCTLIHRAINGPHWAA